MEIYFLNRKEFFEHMDEFADLYKLCFGVPMDGNEVEWRYLKNPQQDVFSCVAFDKGKLVANYSVSPIEINVGGNILPAAQSLNTMTHPEYLGKGLFVNLASKVYQKLEETNRLMVMGFPNNISNRTFLTKLGWNGVATIPTLQMDLNRVGKQRVRDFLTVEDSRFELDYSHIQDHYSQGNQISVYKPKEYLHWRYFQCPAFEYHNFVVHNNNVVSSRVIIKEFRNRVNIVDAVFQDEEEQKALINRVIDFGKTRNKELITCWAPLNSKEHIMFEKYGATLEAPISYFGGRVFNPGNYRLTDLYNPFNWILNMSDDNVY